jgi:hypothetical protein
MADIQRTSRCFALVPIVLQKSFCTDDQKFYRPQVRLSCKDVRDLIASRQTHRRLRQRDYGYTNRRLLPVSCFREKFVTLQLSTFATQSAKVRHSIRAIPLREIGFGRVLISPRAPVTFSISTHLFDLQGRNLETPRPCVMSKEFSERNQPATAQQRATLLCWKEKKDPRARE